MRNILTTTIVAAMAIVAVPAMAVPTLTISDGTTTLTVSDGAFMDSNPTVGAITWIGSIGVWNLNVTTGVGVPAQGSYAAPNMDLSSIDISSGAGTLTLTWSDSPYTYVGQVGMDIGGTTANGTVAASILQDGSVIGSIPTFTASPFAGTGSATVTAGGAGTLSEQIVITHTGAGSSSFDASLSVPDGGTTVGLLGFALMGVETVRRRMRK